jgi:hypothetical protein
LLEIEAFKVTNNKQQKANKEKEEKRRKKGEGKKGGKRDISYYRGPGKEAAGFVNLFHV